MTAGAARTGTLLVVDDNEANRDALSRRLALKGYQVRVASGGAEALRLIAAGPFDLVLVVVEGSHFLWKMVRRMVGVAAGLPDAKLVLLPGCAHVPQLQSPELFLSAVSGFLSGGSLAPRKEALRG